jgi:toxin-antitoxin system PIN domain toxin
MTWLLDGNVLVALVIDSHLHHQTVHSWVLQQRSFRFATCAITQGTLLRLHMRFGADPSATAAWTTLQAIERLPFHEFWEAGFSFSSVDHGRLQGPRQVTDAWLAQLARTKRGKLATLDAGCAELHSDVAVLL